MKEVIQAFNELKENAIISDFAIGGGVATIFYTEPIDTLDIDIFVILPNISSLISLAGVYASLSNKGFLPEGEYIKIGSTLAQVIVAPSPLEEEAIREANITIYEGLPCKIFKAEHLITICLRVGRSRDYYKASLLLEQAPLDKTLLETIITRYNLGTAWKKLTNK